MAKNFLDEDTHNNHKTMGYMDGFRFGFGMFVAWLLGALIVGGLAFAVAAILKVRS